MEKTPTFSKHSVYMHGTMEFKFLPSEKITEEATNRKGSKEQNSSPCGKGLYSKLRFCLQLHTLIAGLLNKVICYVCQNWNIPLLYSHLGKVEKDQVL